MSLNFDQLWDLGSAGKTSERTLQHLYKLVQEPDAPQELKVCVSRVELENLETVVAVNRAAEALVGLSNASPWSTRALFVMSQGYAECGFASEADQFANEAQVTAAPNELGCAFLAKAQAAVAGDDLGEACAATASAIKEFSTQGRTSELVSATIQLGTLRKEMGQPSAAARAFEIAGRHLAPAQVYQKVRLEGLVAAVSTDRSNEAVRKVVSSVAWAEEHNYGRALLDHYVDYADALIETGDAVRAAAIAKKLTVLAERAAIVRSQKIGMETSAVIYEANGDFEGAKAMREMALRVLPTNKLSDSTRIQHTLIQLRKLQSQVQAKAS